MRTPAQLLPTPPTSPHVHKVERNRALDAHRPVLATRQGNNTAHEVLCHEVTEGPRIFPSLQMFKYVVNVVPLGAHLVCENACCSLLGCQLGPRQQKGTAACTSACHLFFGQKHTSINKVYNIKYTPANAHKRTCSDRTTRQPTGFHTKNFSKGRERLNSMS